MAIQPSSVSSRSSSHKRRNQSRSSSNSTKQGRVTRIRTTTTTTTIIMILFTMLTTMTNTAIRKKKYNVIAFTVGYTNRMITTTTKVKTKTISTPSSSSSSSLHHHHQMRRYISSSASVSSSSSSSALSSNNNDNNNDDTIGIDIDGSSSSSSASSSFFANSDVTFESMGIQSPILLDRLHQNLGLERPTQIQAQAFTEIRGCSSSSHTDTPPKNGNENFVRSKDVTIGAETGSGKTLAYLLPLMDDILCEKAQAKQRSNEEDADTNTSNSPNSCLPSYDYARAIILVPNKELVQQVLRMAVPLCGGRTLEDSIVWAPGGGGGYSGRDNRSSTNPTLQHLVPHLPNNKNNNNADADDGYCPSTQIRLAVMPGGLREPMDFKPFRDSIGFGGDQPPVDLVITTPTSFGPLGLPPKFVDLFADVSTLVIDEADMLLDGGYLRALENVFMGFRRADKLVDPTPYKAILSPDSMHSIVSNVGVTKTQHVFVAATLPDVGLKSVDAYIQRKFPYATRVNTQNMHNAKHYGLSQPTQWYQIDTKKERLEVLVDMLLLGRRRSSDDIDTDTNTETEISLQGEKTMVFLNSVDDVEMVYQALVQRGIQAVPYHAKISLTERSTNLDRFRRYHNNNGNTDTTTDDTDDDTVPVLVCTDLASRGLDVPGVTAVVQLQFSGNVVSHLHRMGRCGRAGSQTGRGIVFYSEQEAELVEVVQEAERQQETMKLQGHDVDFELEVELESATDRTKTSNSNSGGGGGGNEKKKKQDQGKVQQAFSRKRGFTKKRKKLRREEQERGGEE